MENRFFTWDKFVDNFGKEMATAEAVYDGMAKNGLKDNCLVKMDFTFVSDSKENLDALDKFIRTRYPYTLQATEKQNNLWELNGETNEIPITADNLLYWTLDMYKRGYEFDATLEAYGGPFDRKDQKYPDLVEVSADSYF